MKSLQVGISPRLAGSLEFIYHLSLDIERKSSERVKFAFASFVLLTRHTSRATGGGFNSSGALTCGTLIPRSFYRKFRLRGNGPAAELDSADLDSAIPSGLPIYMSTLVWTQITGLGCIRPCIPVVEHQVGT